MSIYAGLWRTLPATERQKELLAVLGIEEDEKPYLRGQASDLIRALLREREMAEREKAPA